MASALARLENRRRYAVSLGDQPHEQAFVRALTWAEINTAEHLPDDLKTAYVIGCGLLETDGTQAFSPLGAPESPEQFADRVRAQLQNVPLDNVRELCEAIQRVQTISNREAIKKN